MKQYQNVPFSSVDLTDGFWKQKQKMNEDVTIMSVYNRFDDTGRIAAFDFAWKENMPQMPHIYWDSDVAKWMESAAYIMQKSSRPDLEEKMESLIARIIEHQEESGYFNIHFTVVKPDKRFTDRNCHELYCAGHLMEAAVAYYDATGRRAFLDAMCRYADHIYDVFVVRDAAAFTTPGHEEIELALIRLYEATGCEKYKELSRFFIDRRGVAEKDAPIGRQTQSYCQSHLPCAEQTTAEGHSVRAVYLYSGMADIARVCDRPELFNACETLFANMIEQRMYITGGIGSSASGERFTVNYDLPNKEAYSESCAAIGLAFFANRMLRLTADSRYADVIERVFYNGFLSSISLDGQSFFYENPLEIDLALHERNRKMNSGRFPITQRKKVFDCSCCPPNITRFFATLGNYLYTYDDETVFVHQYMNAEASFARGAETVSITQSGNYPNEGALRITASGVRGKIAVRIPAWCESFTLNHPYTVEKGYAYIDVPAGGKIDIALSFDMTPYFVVSDSRVQNDAGRVAVMRGPVLYCLEAPDNGQNLHGIFVDTQNPNFQVDADAESGLTTVTLRATRRSVPTLYSRLAHAASTESIAKLIPYSSFGNRGEADMLVWLSCTGL